jgi:hypothetical protein
VKTRKPTIKEVEKIAKQAVRDGVLLDWEDLVYARVPDTKRTKR